MSKRNKSAAVAIAAPQSEPEPTTPLKLDIGCGKNKLPGFTGVDVRAFEGVDMVVDLTKPWPWPDNSVDEVHASHFIEHLDGMERVHFANESYRVMKPGAKMMVITPHWNSPRAYGDVTHKWPPVSEWWSLYLNAEWRAVNAPHNDFYTCNFAVTSGYSLRQDIAVRNAEYQQFAIQNFKDAAQDIVSTFIKA